jgi:hypothetical protein
MPKSNKNMPVQASSFINLTKLEPFHNRLQEGYASIPVGDHMETWKINSRGFRLLVGRLYYMEFGKPLKPANMKELLALLEAQALYDGPEKEVHVRVAHQDKKIYVDLGNERWQAVEITAFGWQVIDNPPVKFCRPQTLAPYPMPASIGSIEELRPFINCNDEDWPIVVGWILGAFSLGPYPLLMLQGEAGTAKSSLARILKSIVDPDTAPLLARPRTLRDLAVSANNSWCLAFDNFSGITKSWSNAFCQLATGIGDRGRRLYTATEETVINVKRPLIITSIESLAREVDLADRSILLNLPVIQDRLTERDMRRRFDKVWPKVLRAIFDVLAAALKNFKKVTQEDLPRMADFAEWVVAAEPALPWEPGAFMAAYNQNRAEVVDRSLESDPVALVVMELVRRQSYSGGEWRGTPTRLLEALTTIANQPGMGGTDRDWPSASNKLSEKLNSLATFLRTKGIEFERGWIGSQRAIILRKVS